jgi:hypothetical protein
MRGQYVNLVERIIKLEESFKDVENLLKEVVDSDIIQWSDSLETVVINSKKLLKVIRVNAEEEGGISVIKISSGNEKNDEQQKERTKKAIKDMRQQIINKIKNIILKHAKGDKEKAQEIINKIKEKAESLLTILQATITSKILFGVEKFEDKKEEKKADIVSSLKNFKVYKKDDEFVFYAKNFEPPVDVEDSSAEEYASHLIA